MGIPLEGIASLGSKTHSARHFKKHFQSVNQMHRMKTALIANVKSLTLNSQTSKAKHQVLFLTIILIILTTIMFIAVNNIQMNIFASLLSNGFNFLLKQQNAKYELFSSSSFQSSVLISYMQLTRKYFENDQYILTAINNIYNYSLQSNYSIDLGEECHVFKNAGKYPSYSKIDQLCYTPQNTTELSTFENSTLNTEFVKFTSVLNQFILCFGFQQSFEMNNALQITLDNQDQMVSYYPQISPIQEYCPRQRPFFIYQKQQYELNITRKFYLSNYEKFSKKSMLSIYGQKITQSLLNQSQFEGVISISIQFSVFYSILYNFPDVNLALVDFDGTLLFEQTQIEKYDHRQFIYNQSSTGYNYLDWMKLSAHQDWRQQLVMNNTLFNESIKVNIKKFKDLPYYFIVYNNLTYENQIRTIQVQIFDKVNIQYRRALLLFGILLIGIVIGVYCSIEYILRPLVMIKKIVYCHNYNFQQFKQLRQTRSSTNILHILQLISYLKYSELYNLSFKKSIQCQKLEDLKYSLKQFNKREMVLVQYLAQKQLLIDNLTKKTTCDNQFSTIWSELVSKYNFTLQ